MPERRYDPIKDPVESAARIFRDHLDYFRQQVIEGQQPERQARLGELPAAPIVEQVAAQIAQEQEA